MKKLLSLIFLLILNWIKKKPKEQARIIVLTRSKETAKIQLSKHFKAGEFFCKCGLCEKQIIDRRLVEQLERLAEQLRCPIKISSGYRCAKHNRAVKGVPKSQHRLGKAADIKARYYLPTSVRKFAIGLFDGIGLYSKFLHVDVRGKKAYWKGAY